MSYEGRMVSDGNGNLLADEGADAGKPIAYDPDTDTYEFVKPGEPSHNERHHLQFAQAIPTQGDDPEFPGYAGSEGDPTEGNEHHFDDPADAVLHTHPDSLAREISGHTNQTKLGGE